MGVEAGVLKDVWNLRSIQLALEQHRFELQGPTYMHFFFFFLFNKYTLQLYTLHRWLKS